MKSGFNQFLALRRSKEQLEARDVTLREVAVATGVSHETIRMIERRPLSRTFRLFVALLRYYDLKITDRAGNEYFTNE